MSTCTRCGKWNGAHATLPGQPTDRLCMCQPVATPTRTEFEAAAYRWLRENCGDTKDSLGFAICTTCVTPKQMDGAVAAAMGWPTVPEVKS